MTGIGEIEVRRTIAELAEDDPIFAHGLVGVLLDATDREKSAALRSRFSPDRTECLQEVQLQDREGKEMGSVDLLFFDHDGGGFLLT